MGWGDMPDKNPELKMPNIESMMSSGIRFDRFYSASCVCSPSRAAVLTGQFPKRVGVTVPNANGAHNDGNVKQNMRWKHTTIADALRDLGYATGLWGKWHLGDMRMSNSIASNCHPGNAGFDDWLSTSQAQAWHTLVLLR
jgi:arylsulfatase A-like enzyme